MSAIIWSFGTAATGTSGVLARGWVCGPLTAAVGSTRRTRLRRASATIRSAFWSWSSSTRLLPRARPRAARNVLAMPPPTSTAWQRDRSASSTSSLPDTFAPPMTAWNGRAGLVSRRERASTSRSMRSPATAGRWCVIPSVLAWARCAAPKASSTYRSARLASAAANSWALASSAAWKRRFSSSSRSPARSLSTATWTPGPSASPVIRTGRPSSWLSRSATGLSRSASLTLPFGRPRWLARITVAPRSRRLTRVGRLARMRVSSVMRPSSSGTFRSARTKTRRPSTSTSRIVLASIAGLEPLGHEGGEIRHPAGVAPFVVVPGDDLDEVLAGHHGRRRIEDRAAVVALEIHADELLLGVAEQPFHRPISGCLERRVGALRRHRLLGDGDEVDDAHRRGRHPEGEAVEAALQLRDHQGDRLRRAGRGRDDVLAGAARAAQVLVEHVQHVLVVRVAVDRGHQAALDAEAIENHLGREGEAVRRAAGVADDVVLLAVVGALVDAEDQRDVLALGGRRDDHLPGAGGAVRGGLLGIGEDPGRFDHDVDAEVSPRQSGRVLLAEGF